MLKRIRWSFFAVLAVGIGLYPVVYFLTNQKMGLLTSKSDDLLSAPLWNLGFYTHILFGGLALLVGWTQFSTKLRTRYLSVHRRIGKIYVIAVLLSALAAVYIGFFATGGFIPASGFICLGCIWFYTTLQAYRYIRQKDQRRHQIMMIYSYAACFGAVTLRLWLPVLTIVFNDFITGYRIVAWLCWVPNLAVAHFVWAKPLLRKTGNLLTTH
ncbi:MAG: DUF2306 domain-containing protein [Lewinellaceae bacterium]|nr:DUF2306 domain-containing protein [Lewinellaceae bacterium]